MSRHTFLIRAGAEGQTIRHIPTGQTEDLRNEDRTGLSQWASGICTTMGIKDPAKAPKVRSNHQQHRSAA